MLGSGKLVSWLAGALLLASCAALPTDPGYRDTSSVDGYVIYGWAQIGVVPFEYEVEFADARSCIRAANANGFYGQPRNVKFEDVTWMVADSAIRVRDNVYPGAFAETELDKLRITIVRPWLNDRGVIFHESLHIWLGPEPSHGQGSFAICNAQRGAG